MATSVSITKIVADGQNCAVYFNLPLSGSYVSGGDTVDFTKAVQDAAFQGMSIQIPSSSGPTSFDIWDSSGNILNEIAPVMGTLQSNCKIKFGAASTFGTEFSGAYSAGLLASKLQGFAVFPKNI